MIQELNLYFVEEKTKIREYIHEKLGTGSTTATITTTEDIQKYMIPRPKENSHAFYMYLLPPYTVVSLKTKTEDLYTKGTVHTDVTQAYLNERYPQINYAQVGTTVTLNQASTDWDSTKTIATVGSSDTTAIGWLNRGIDYGVADISN